MITNITALTRDLTGEDLTRLLQAGEAAIVPVNQRIPSQFWPSLGVGLLEDLIGNGTIVYPPIEPDVLALLNDCRKLFEGCKLMAIKLEGGRVWLYFDNGFKIDTNSDRIGFAESDVQVV